jgi:hypothetical protein
MISPGYRLNSATEFSELEGPGIDQELDEIPGIGRNSHRFPEFQPIPFYLAIPEFRAELDDQMAR